MSTLNKTSNGLFFFDDFSEETLLWTLSPSDANCLSFGDNGLQIKHNENYITYTIVEPSTDTYSCIVKLDHIPFNKEDIAGIIVMSTTKEYAECQSYMATERSYLVNGDEIDTDYIKALIDEIMADKYVEYSVDDNEVDNDITTGESGNKPQQNPDNSVVFVDTIYKYIKFTKVKFKYVFWASEDGLTWIEIGNVKFADSGVIGFFLYSTENQELIDNSHCYFNSFALYNSKYITLEGIDKIHEFEIYDKYGNIILRSDSTQYAGVVSRVNKKCLINTTTMPMPFDDAILRIFPHDKYSTTISQFSLGEKTYGGDGFTLERNLKLFINNQEINASDLYDLGTFYRGSYFIKLDIYNNEDYILNDVKVKVIKYSEYYGGEEEVAIALHSEDHIESELIYDKEVTIDSIAPSEGRSIYMKLMDRPIQDFYMTANSYKFKIVIE